MSGRAAQPHDAQLELHIVPTLGTIPIGKLTASVVRHWYAGLMTKGLSRNTGAKCYRLLRSICNTAVTDGLIARNPCRIEGAGVERAEERQIASVDQGWAAADAMPKHLQLAVLIAGFVGLRTGEILGLERQHIDVLTLQPENLAGPEADKAGYEHCELKVLGHRVSGSPALIDAGDLALFGTLDAGAFDPAWVACDQSVRDRRVADRA